MPLLAGPLGPPSCPTPLLPMRPLEQGPDLRLEWHARGRTRLRSPARPAFGGNVRHAHSLPPFPTARERRRRPPSSPRAPSCPATPPSSVHTRRSLPRCISVRPHTLRPRVARRSPGAAASMAAPWRRAHAGPSLPRPRLVPRYDCAIASGVYSPRRPRARALNAGCASCTVELHRGARAPTPARRPSLTYPLQALRPCGLESLHTPTLVSRCVYAPPPTGARPRVPLRRFTAAPAPSCRRHPTSSRCSTGTNSLASAPSPRAAAP